LDEEVDQVRVGKVLKVAKVDVPVVNQDNLEASVGRTVVRANQVVVRPSRVVVLSVQSNSEQLGILSNTFERESKKTTASYIL
jgi:hypothetical protein